MGWGFGTYSLESFIKFLVNRMDLFLSHTKHLKPQNIRIHQIGFNTLKFHLNAFNIYHLAFEELTLHRSKQAWTCVSLRMIISFYNIFNPAVTVKYLFKTHLSVSVDRLYIISNIGYVYFCCFYIYITFDIIKCSLKVNLKTVVFSKYQNEFPFSYCILSCCKIKL